MVILTKCEHVGHTSQQELQFAMTASDGNQYEFAITPECFMQLFALGWSEGRKLGQPKRDGQAVGLETDASAAVLNMQPGLVLLSGPMSLAIPLTEDVLAALQIEAARLARNSPTN